MKVVLLTVLLLTAKVLHGNAAITPQPKTTTDSGLIFSCTFEQSVCGFITGGSKFRKYSAKTLKQLGRPTPPIDHTTMTETGNFIYLGVDTNFPLGPPQMLSFPRSVVTSINDETCLQFYLHHFGKHAAQLGVITSNDFIKPVWTHSATDRNSWNMASVSLPKPSGTFLQVVAIRVMVNGADTGDVAIDDVSLQKGACVSPGTVLGPPFTTPSPITSTVTHYSTADDVTTTLTDGPECNDHVTICQHVVKNGNCNAPWLREKMVKNCAKSCGFCSGGTGLPYTAPVNATLPITSTAQQTLGAATASETQHMTTTFTIPFTIEPGTKAGSTSTSEDWSTVSYSSSPPEVTDTTQSLTTTSTFLLTSTNKTPSEPVGMTTRSSAVRSTFSKEATTDDQYQITTTGNVITTKITSNEQSTVTIATQNLSTSRNEVTIETKSQGTVTQSGNTPIVPTTDYVTSASTDGHFTSELPVTMLDKNRSTQWSVDKTVSPSSVPLTTSGGSLEKDNGEFEFKNSAHERIPIYIGVGVGVVVIVLVILAIVLVVSHRKNRSGRRAGRYRENSLKDAVKFDNPIYDKSEKSQV